MDHFIEGFLKSALIASSWNPCSIDTLANEVNPIKLVDVDLPFMYECCFFEMVGRDKHSLILKRSVFLLSLTNL